MNIVASPGSEILKTAPLSFLDLSLFVAGLSGQKKLPPLSLHLEGNMNRKDVMGPIF
jgi:hypothetical protein